ncbi:hypothetical protein [Kutzneria sp. NPDC051319]|uniref:hypothetical protein n=1 Tax=Kutzneria sp. NPDC051319 TaxID=3155047 RepID=UPI0034152BD5
MTAPVPVDVAELVARVLRAAVTGRADPVAAGLKISTETGRGRDGGPPSLPWVVVAEDSHTWRWPAVQSATVRLTAWHRTEHDAKHIAGLVLGLLCDRATAIATPGLILSEPDTAPIADVDPYTGEPIAFAVAVVTVRTPTT